MTTTKRLEPMLWLSDARGIYIPRDWANSFNPMAATIHNVSDDDMAILRAGPDGNEFYWDAWQNVLDHCVIKDDKGNAFTVYQDGDCWLIPEGMVWDDDAGFYVWPSETEEG